jgi:hypothetical protein
MKKSVLLYSVFARLSLLLTGCSKSDRPCTNYTGPSNTGRLVNLTTVRSG